MDRMIAYCGLNCSECPTFLATRADDDQMREKVAAQWSKQFRMQFSVQDINCDGCKTENGRLFGHCKTCQIRACCAEKELETCAECRDYACDNLNAFLAFVPQARASLEKIRAEKI
jgi:hypothetical protein